MSPLTDEQLSAAAGACLELQRTAQDIHSKRPFVALLLAPDNTTVLMSSLSLSHVRHAETELARNAADNYARDYLAKTTLVSTWEPCAMCAGTIYWANIGRLVYLASEKTLRQLTGEGNVENLTLDLPCRTIFASGQTEVEVIGPVSGWEAKVAEDSQSILHEAGYDEEFCPESLDATPAFKRVDFLDQKTIAYLQSVKGVSVEYTQEEN